MRIELNPGNPPNVVNRGRVLRGYSASIEEAIDGKNVGEWIAFHFDSKEEADIARNKILQRRLRRKKQIYSRVTTKVIGNTLYVLKLENEVDD